MSKKLNKKQVDGISDSGKHPLGESLYLNVTPPHGRSWLFRIKVKGKTSWVGLGSTRDVTLAEAREACAAVRRYVKAGGNPKMYGKEEATPTFSEAAQRTYDTKVNSFKDGRHTGDWLATLRNHAFPHIGDKQVSEITSADIVLVLTPIWHTKAETARRVRQRVASVVKWARANGFFQGECPTTHVDAEALGRQRMEVQHHPSMPYAEVPALMQKLAQRKAMSAMALRFLILCASRFGEVQGCCWSEIDLEARIWKIPAQRMKASKEHIVPLCDEAIAILETVNSEAKGEMVFPSRQPGGNHGLSETSFRNLLSRMSVEGVTTHGFRTSFRTWAQEQCSAPFEVLERCIAHEVGNKVSQAYARSDLLEQRRHVMEAWGRFVSDVERGNVVQLRNTSG